MAEHPAKRSKKKVTVDSPFPPPSLREIPASQEAAAVAELVALGPKRLVVGGNQVLRALENNAVSLVFLAGLHAPDAGLPAWTHGTGRFIHSRQARESFRDAPCGLCIGR